MLPRLRPFRRCGIPLTLLRDWFCLSNPDCSQTPVLPARWMPQIKLQGKPHHDGWYSGLRVSFILRCQAGSHDKGIRMGVLSFWIGHITPPLVVTSRRGVSSLARSSNVRKRAFLASSAFQSFSWIVATLELIHISGQNVSVIALHLRFSLGSPFLPQTLGIGRMRALDSDKAPNWNLYKNLRCTPCFFFSHSLMEVSNL